MAVTFVSIHRMFRPLARIASFLRPMTIQSSNQILQNNIKCLRNFSMLSNIINRSLTPTAPITPLLQPAAVTLNIERGFKQVGRLKRRCKDCYFVMRQERLYVICKTHPRHKQMAMKKKPKNSWLLTDATQSPYRPF